MAAPWVDNAREAALAMPGPFSGNDLWQQGLPKPPDGNRRRLGKVLVDLSREGRIQRIGTTESHGGHGQPINRWLVNTSK